MANANRDQNSVTALLVKSSDDDAEIVALEADPITGRLKVDAAISSGGSSGAQYEDDAAHTSGDTGTLSLVVRSDAGGSLVDTDGDYAPLQVDSSGALRVTGGGGGTEYNEDSATPATIAGGAVMMERDDALSNLTPIEGDWASLRCTAQGALWVEDSNSDTLLTEIQKVSGAISGTEMQVDIVGSLPAGTNTIGKLAANNGVDIGDVTINNAGGASAINIQDGGNTITVDGTVSVEGGNSTDVVISLDGEVVSTTHTITGIAHGSKAVTTAGTPVPLAASTTCKRITIQANTDNTGIIVVGGSGVSAASGTGVALYAGDAYELEIDNLADVYLDSSVNGEGVRFTYYT